MIASPNPLASSAGIEILNKGGNAADAAVATAAVLNVVDPCNCGIGGDAFCLFFNSGDQSLKGLNGSGRSPAALSLEKARELGMSGREIPIKNINSFVFTLLETKAIALTDDRLATVNVMYSV